MVSSAGRHPSKDPQNVLILQTAFLGDLILTLPLIQAARDLFPKARICPLVIPATSEILQHHPAVDRLLIDDKQGKDRGLAGFLRISRQLRRERFDLALVPHRSLRSALLVSFAGIPRRVGFSAGAGSFLFTDVVTRRSEVHEVERNLDLLRGLGITVPTQPPHLYPRESDRQQAQTFLIRQGISPQQLLIGIAPGSVWPTKRWLPESFAEVIGVLRRTRGMTAVLMGGIADRALCQKIAEQSGAGVLVAAGDLPVLSSAALMQRCRLVLSNDSAAAHLAAAVGRPVVTIFGPTVPQFGFAPFGPGHRIVEQDVPCRPCGVHGGKRCPRKNFACMRDISPNRVLEAVQSILSSNTGEPG